MRFAVSILGSNSAIPARDRHPTAQVLHLQEKCYLIDCGEGTQMRFPYHQIRHQRIEHVFISHLHGDHYYGLIGLISSYNLVGRTKPLHIHAHAPLEEIIGLQLSASATELRYPLIFHAIDPDQDGLIHEDEIIEVQAFPLVHRIPTHGFLFRERSRPRNIIKQELEGLSIPVEAYKELKMGMDVVLPDGRELLSDQVTTAAPLTRSYAYVTDTRVQWHLIDKLEGVDLLYHEATFLKEMEEMAHDKYHATTVGAASLARAARVGRLIIGHFSSRYKELDLFLQQAREVFPETFLATEGTVFEVEKHQQS